MQSVIPHLSRRGFLAAASALALPALPARAEPLRLITIGAPVTEIVFALGGGGEIVATDTTSRYPESADALPKVGYMRTLSAEGLLSMTPDVVIAEDGSGPPNVFERLRALGVKVALVSDRPTADGLTGKIAAIGNDIGRETEAKALSVHIAARFAALGKSDVEGLRGRPVLCLAHILSGKLLAAGAGTVGDALIRLANGRNVLASSPGYHLAAAEAIVAAAPEMLIVGRDMLAGAGGPEALLARPDLALTPAAAAHSVVAIDDILMIGFGPRTPDAVGAILATG